MDSNNSFQSFMDTLSKREINHKLEENLDTDIRLEQVNIRGIQKKNKEKITNNDNYDLLTPEELLTTKADKYKKTVSETKNKTEAISFDFGTGLSFNSHLSEQKPVKENQLPIEMFYDNEKDFKEITQNVKEENNLHSKNDAIFVTLDVQIYEPVEIFSEEVIEKTKFILDKYDFYNSSYHLQPDETDSNGLDVENFLDNKYMRNTITKEKSVIDFTGFQRNGKIKILRRSKDCILPRRPTRKVSDRKRPKFNNTEQKRPKFNNTKENCFLQRPKFNIL